MVGQGGMVLHCSLLHEQSRTWHVRRFVATVGEAYALLNIQENDWTWQVVSPLEAREKEPKQEYISFLMFLKEVCALYGDGRRRTSTRATPC
ncbi:MAG TPA: hypothetical protein VFA09_19820 [Ktedonobacteraceae bacterium]|nr:hypothetical protein [Ktedonobacteraceae bacterium]